MSVPERDWSLEETAELVIEQILELLDGCDDDDTIRPEMVMDAVSGVWSPEAMYHLAEGTTAGELRAELNEGRRRLAAGEKLS